LLRAAFRFTCEFLVLTGLPQVFYKSLEIILPVWSAQLDAIQRLAIGNMDNKRGIMLQFRLSKSVKRVVLPPHISAALASSTPGAVGSVDGALSRGSFGGMQVVKHKKKRKKLSRGSRPMERLVRRMARANRKSSDIYLDRHNRSNRKKRNGWLRDLSYNVMRSNRKGQKGLKLSKLF